MKANDFFIDERQTLNKHRKKKKYERMSSQGIIMHDNRGQNAKKMA